MKGAPGRGTLEKEKPPILGMIQRGGQVVLKMLANVQQTTIKPIIEAGVAKGALIHTDEYDIYARVSYGDTDTRPFATGAANMRAMRTATAFMKSVSIRRGLLVAAAFMAATASRRRPRKVAALSRLLPVRAQCQKTWKSAADGAR